MGVSPYIAEIVLFGGNFAPRGWAFCNGQLLSISQNTALFSLLGTTYGGDGTTTFALPDLRGRVPIHAGGFNGQGPGLSLYALGQTAGEEAHTLNNNEMPQHTHPLPASTADATSNRPDPSRVPARGGAYAGNGSTNTSLPSSASGGNQPHNNIQPYQALNYIIAVEGIYPSRN